MLKDIQQEVDKLINEINHVTSTNEIYLFGSFAYGVPNEGSDIDLCIITNDKNIRKIELVKSIRKSISKIATMPIDILVYDRDEFNERAALESTIEHKIAIEGVSIYAQ